MSTKKAKETHWGGRKIKKFFLRFLRNIDECLCCNSALVCILVQLYDDDDSSGALACVTDFAEAYFFLSHRFQILTWRLTDALNLSELHDKFMRNRLNFSTCNHLWRRRVASFCASQAALTENEQFYYVHLKSNFWVLFFNFSTVLDITRINWTQMRTLK